MQLKKKLVALLAVVWIALLSFGAPFASAANDTATTVSDAVSSINAILPMMMTFMIVMLIFSFIGGFFAGMNRAVSKMQVS